MNNNTTNTAQEGLGSKVMSFVRSNWLPLLAISGGAAGVGVGRFLHYRGKKKIKELSEKAKNLKINHHSEVQIPEQAYGLGMQHMGYLIAQLHASDELTPEEKLKHAYVLANSPEKHPYVQSLKEEADKHLSPEAKAQYMKGLRAGAKTLKLLMEGWYIKPGEKIHNKEWFNTMLAAHGVKLHETGTAIAANTGKFANEKIAGITKEDIGRAALLGAMVGIPLWGTFEFVRGLGKHIMPGQLQREADINISAVTTEPHIPSSQIVSSDDARNLARHHFYTALLKTTANTNQTITQRGDRLAALLKDPLNHEHIKAIYSKVESKLSGPAKAHYLNEIQRLARKHLSKVNSLTPELLSGVETYTHITRIGDTYHPITLTRTLSPQEYEDVAHTAVHGLLGEAAKHLNKYRKKVEHL